MNQRHVRIIELLEKTERIEVMELANVLGVSRVTIRKDLEVLEKKGLLQRHHGYALRVSADDINYRMAFDYEIKKRISLEAAALVSNGETIMIESGSTCAMLATQIASTLNDVTIVTNSVFIATHLRPFNTVKVVLLGGDYHADAEVMVGPLTRLCASKYFIDKFFIGVDGFILGQGFTNLNIMRAEAVQAMADNAQQKIILTDSSKFSQRGVCSLLTVDQVTSVITDDAIPQDIMEYLQDAKIKLTIVSSK